MQKVSRKEKLIATLRKENKQLRRSLQGKGTRKFSAPAPSSTGKRRASQLKRWSRVVKDTGGKRNIRRPSTTLAEDAEDADAADTGDDVDFTDLRGKGVYTADVRLCVYNLIQEQVPVKHIAPVISTVLKNT